MGVCQERFCSVLSQSVGEDPAGTAGHYDLLILLEVPLPWEREIHKSPGFPPELFDLGLEARDCGINFRYLCVVPDPEYASADRRRVVLFRRPGGAMARYQREEYLAPPADVPDLIRSLLRGESPSLGREETGPVRDLLVCTHGSMDAACGRYGYPVFESLRRGYASANLRVWRVNHFGGHRFAPTLMEMPEGRWWAHLEPGALEAVVQRTGPVSSLHRFYRGWGALATPFEQVLERELFEREGWAWIDGAKRSTVVERCPEGRWAEVSIAFESPDGSRSVYTGRVEVSHQVTTVMATGRESEPTPQYRVTRLDKQALSQPV